MIRPVLLRLGDPEQLVSWGRRDIRQELPFLTLQQRQLELASPHLIGNDEEAWLMFIKRDIPNWQSKLRTPGRPDDWWKVYRVCETNNG